MKSAVKILFAVSEAVPFLATGGMGQVAGALSAALKKLHPRKYDIRVVMPLYGAFREQYQDEFKFVGETTVQLAWRNQYCGVFEYKQDNVTYYFVDNRHYFDRDNAYGYGDDGERFAFFSKAVFSVMELVDFVPDVVHAHDWQTALVPIYVKTRLADKYPDMKTVFTIHNLEYQGKFPYDILIDVFDLCVEDAQLVEYDGCINLVKGAIVCTDKLTTVSPSYAWEIQHGGGFGLDAILLENSYKLSGIINGIDYEEYNPETNTELEKNYTIDTLDAKMVNKMKLQSLLGLPVSPRTMIVCVVSRLVSHKGMDLITRKMNEILNLDLQFVLLGTGDHDYEMFFSEKTVSHPDKLSANITFNPELAMKVFAGADVVLMPSFSEPCGLVQMIACRYGTIPIVRKVGGLGDTIRDCRAGDGNGFVFDEYNADLLLDTIIQALDLYKYREEDWKNLMKSAMESDFSWDVSAKAYGKIYEELAKK